MTFQRKNLRRWAFVAAAAIAGVPLVSCGGDNSQASAPAAPQAQPAFYQGQQPVQLAQAPIPQPIYTPIPAPMAPAPLAAPVPVAAPVPMLADSQLGDLTSSIALYPDPLIAVMLPAATYPNDIAAADQWLATHPNPDQLSIDSLPFQPSVKDLVHYPTVLAMMAQNPAWTQALGIAFVYQQPALMDSIQRWRATAVADNSLYTTQQIQVANADGLIEILPAAPGQIYVPVYDPGVVYVHHDRHEDLLRFGVSFSGQWLDHDLDWRQHQVREPARIATPDRGRDVRPTVQAPPPERRVFTRNDYHPDRYPDKIVTPQDHRVITPTARGEEARHDDHPAAPAARGEADRGGPDRGGPARGDRGGDRGDASGR